MDFLQAFSVLGAVLATILAVLRLREYMLQTPRFDVTIHSGDNIDHLDFYIGVVKRGSAACYLSVIGLAWGRGLGRFVVDFHTGSGLREMGETAALTKNAYLPGRLERRYRKARRPQPMNGVALDPSPIEFPRLMQIEGDSIFVKRCAARLAGMVRMFGGPPTFVVALDTVGRASWTPIPDSLRSGILQTAMDDATDPASVPPCPDVSGGLYAGQDEAGSPMAILVDDKVTFFHF